MKALLEAVQQKNASLVRSLIKSNKVDVNYVYPMEEYTVLHVAASAGSLEIVKILVEEGHAVSLSNRIEEYPIDEAAQNDHVDVVQYLEGKDPYGLHTGKDYSYLHMLMPAWLKNYQVILSHFVRYFFIEIVNILVEEGHAESIANEIEEYPIHQAGNNGHDDVIRYLEGISLEPHVTNEMLDMLLPEESIDSR